MTTPTSDAPTPDIPSTRAGRKRLIAIAVGTLLLLVLVIILVVGRVAASNRVDAYETSFEEWTDDNLTGLVLAATELPQGLYDSDDSADVLARQKEACDEVDAIGGKIEERSSSMPVLTTGLWGPFSGDLRAAAETSKRRSEQLTTAQRASAKAVEQIRADCRWNINQFSDDRYDKVNDLDDRAEKLLDPKGASDTVCSGGGCTTYTCTDPEGCLPFGQADLRRSGELQLAADTLRGEIDQTHLAEEECGRTSYVTMCSTLAEGLRKVNDASQRYDRVVRDGAADGPLDDALEARDNALDDLTADFTKALKSERPYLARREPQLGKEWDDTDQFLQCAADLLMENVSEAVKPITGW